jgi:hypothetical protein
MKKGPSSDPSLKPFLKSYIERGKVTLTKEIKHDEDSEKLRQQGPCSPTAPRSVSMR